VLWYKGRICVPDVKEIKNLILQEAHDSAYSIHLRGNKMYQDLSVSYWWYGMKCEVVEYVALCDTCQRVKEKHQHPAKHQHFRYVSCPRVTGMGMAIPGIRLVQEGSKMGKPYHNARLAQRNLCK
jgi:hypothetical protein